MGMDMMYLQDEIREERFIKATNTINEINKILEKFYGNDSREDLKKEIDILRSENLKLRGELGEYKELIHKIGRLEELKERGY